MDIFSMRGAWSFGLRILSHRLGIHFMILIGVGIVLPFLLQFAITGGVLGMSNPVMLGQSGMTPGGAAGMGGAPGSTGVALGLTYALQLASYFMSWRLAFGGYGSLGGGISFGLVASLLAMAVFAAIGVPAVVAAQAVASSGVPFLGLLIVLIPLVTVFAFFYTFPAAMLATIASIVLVLTMVLGTVTGNVGMAATLIGGGSGAVVVLFLVMSAALLWLAARFSCATSVMADRKSWNLIAALRESWSLTLEDQWVILRYLALVAFAMALVVVGAAIVAGMGAAAFFRASTGAVQQIGTVILALAFGIPVAFLTVLIPAGIYRELTRSSLAAEVFA